MLFLTILFSLLGCSVNENTSIAAPTIYKPTESLTVLSSVSKTGPEIDISANFGFLENHRLWNTGSWQSKANKFTYSDDFGKSWSSVDLPLNFFGVDGALSFADQTHGLAVASTIILRSQDGGKSWKEVPLPVSSEILDLKSVSFKDSNHGFISGSTSHIIERGSGEGSIGMEILCTNNGGDSWTICYKTSKHDSAWKIVSDSHSPTIVFVEGNTLLRTEDEGKSWKEISLGFVAKDLGADFSGRIWCVGEKGLLRFSSDHGETWSPVEVADAKYQNINWNSISFSQKGLGVAVGENGAIAISRDRGHTWEFRSDITTEELKSVKIQDSTVAILGVAHFFALRVDL